ncbi:MAG TPA: alpha/beta hydrolase [Acidimicrobiia bacterium]|nr:alpha/beta hydrolase [Acidimicrobiia bacterium]
MGTEPTIMLVHGAWHGSWCWERVRSILDADGFITAAVDNPSVTKPGSDLHADADNVRAALDRIDGPVVLVGHSYGGAVISDAGAHPSVAQLVYLTAFALDEGESVMQNALTGGDHIELGEAMKFDGDAVSVDPARVVEFFYHDCEPAVADAAAARLLPMSIAAMAGESRAAAWRTTPAAYIVCTDDRAIPLALQRSCAARIGEVVEMPTSHSPFLSRPADLARVIAELTARVS